MQIKIYTAHAHILFGVHTHTDIIMAIHRVKLPFIQYQTQLKRNWVLIWLQAKQ